MKRRLMPAMPAMHLPHLPQISPRWRGLEHVLRVCQFVLVIWLGVVGGRLLAKSLIQVVESLFRMLS
jgi:hypothetical protein